MVMNLACKCRRPRFDPWIRKIPWRREWEWGWEKLPTLVLLPGEFHGEGSLVGYSPCGCIELDTTERLTLSPFTSFQQYC